MEFHAGTTQLIQMLRKGHHGVQLDAEAWDRLATWIDLNAPCHGTWSEVTPIRDGQRQRRIELQKLYCGVVQDAEETPDEDPPAVPPIVPVRAEPERPTVTLAGWPWTAEEAQRRQASVGELERRVDLGGGIRLQLVRIPVGIFVMGDAAGAEDESPQTAVAIDKPFWLGKFEITNGQFAQFDPQHDSRFEHRSSWIFSEEYLGWPLNRPDQPVVRVSWQQAMDFCRWLSQRTGMQFSLPTEVQWEYACRAGTATPLWYGGLGSDFSAVANMADYNLRDWAYQGWRPKSPDLYLRDDRFNDAALVTAEVGRYEPNPWGLYDLHGNAAEWTRSLYAPYPYRDDDGRNDPAADGQRVVRGGSWFDRPERCRSAFRLAYEPYQPVFNVGFRVVCEP
jgi:formylglycine-generating enzyme required for sulfatase activity